MTEPKLAAPVRDPRVPLLFPEDSTEPAGFTLLSGGENYVDLQSPVVRILCSDAIMLGASFVQGMRVETIKFGDFSLSQVNPYEQLSPGKWRCSVGSRLVTSL